MTKYYLHVDEVPQSRRLIMSYKTFKEHKDHRECEKFESKYKILCETIAYSNIDFEEYWENVGLPTVLKAPQMQSEEELLNEFLGGMRQKMGGAIKGAGHAIGRTGEKTGNWVGGDGYNNDQQVAQNKKDQAMIQKQQERVNQSIGKIYQKFQASMRDFLKSVSDEAKTNNDRLTWQAAQLFHDKALSSMKKFAVNVKKGSDPMKQKFNQDRDAMQQQQQQQPTGGPSTQQVDPRQAQMQQALRPQRSNAATTSGMRLDHSENEDDAIMESLFESYKNRPKFNAF